MLSTQRKNSAERYESVSVTLFFQNSNMPDNYAELGAPCETPKDFKLRAKSTFARFMGLVNEKPEHVWQNRRHEVVAADVSLVSLQSIETLVTTDRSTPLLIRVQADVQAKMDPLFQAMIARKNTERQREFLCQAVSRQALKKLDKHRAYEIFMTRLNKPSLLGLRRELLTLRYVRHELPQLMPDARAYVEFSFNAPETPVESGHLRAALRMCGWFLVRTENPYVTSVTHVFQFDAKGLMTTNGLNELALQLACANVLALQRIGSMLEYEPPPAAPTCLADAKGVDARYEPVIVQDKFGIGQVVNMLADLPPPLPLTPRVTSSRAERSSESPPPLLMALSPRPHHSSSLSPSAESALRRHQSPVLFDVASVRDDGASRTIKRMLTLPPTRGRSNSTPGPQPPLSARARLISSSNSSSLASTLVDDGSLSCSTPDVLVPGVIASQQQRRPSSVPRLDLTALSPVDGSASSESGHSSGSHTSTSSSSSDTATKFVERQHSSDSRSGSSSRASTPCLSPLFDGAISRHSSSSASSSRNSSPFLECFDLIDGSDYCDGVEEPVPVDGEQHTLRLSAIATPRTAQLLLRGVRRVHAIKATL